MNALILTDLQNDFCPGGALAVPQGDEVIPVANRLAPHFDLVVATQDWHPADHGSFAATHDGKSPGERIDLDGIEQILWPVHCVQDTPGAALHSNLDRDPIVQIFQKGTERNIDSYSCFFDNARRKATGLGDYLKQQGVAGLYICGLATDYCVKFTALDAADLGFKVYVVEDACRGVELQPGDIARAIEEMKEKGVEVVRSTEIQASE